MPEKRLLSIAEIARQLDAPESTLHYWKNRFAPYLPSVGRNRQKRFRPEAVDVFRSISEMLKLGHTAEDVMSRLSRERPVNADPLVESCGTVAAPPPAEPQMHADSVKIGAAIGAEIAKVLAETLKTVIQPNGNGRSKGHQIDQALALTGVEEQGERINAMQAENEKFKDKIDVLESELIRLRKDRREMEKYLLDKIRSVAT